MSTARQTATRPAACGPAPSDYPLWHPMTHMPAYLADPITIVGGEGARVWDEDGREYLSASSGLWNIACGFSHPRLIAAITDQLHRLPYGTLFRCGNEPALAFARRLTEIVPWELPRVFYSSSGSAAVETALKAVRRYFRLIGQPRRRLTVCLSRSYHGTSIGAMAVTGEDLEQGEYGVDRADVRVLPTPDPFRCPGEDDAPAGVGRCLAALRELAERERGRIAALIVEPVLGSGGVIVPPQQWFDGVREVCRAHGILLVVDEVATGFGRTGRMFASEWFGLEPDVLVLSKGINGGYVPMGATLFAERIFDAFWRSGACFVHGETQAGNPLACAAGLATLEVIEREHLVANAERIGVRLLERLRGLERHPHVGQVRGRGLMIGVELVHRRVERTPVGLPTVGLVVGLLAREGLLVHPAPSGISLFPPLIITERDAEDIAAALDRVLGGLCLG